MKISNAIQLENHYSGGNVRIIAAKEHVHSLFMTTKQEDQTPHLYWDFLLHCSPLSFFFLRSQFELCVIGCDCIHIYLAVSSVEWNGTLMRIGLNQEVEMR